MALDTPLNQRQLEVLNWINDGCPEGRWTDYTFKTTAQSLASRRLVTVSKRGGTWKAAILPAGEHYLATGAYPAGHWTRPRRTAPGRVQEVKSWAAPSQPVTRAPKKSPAIRASSDDGGLTPTRKLVQDIVDAGGVLEVDTTDDSRSFTSLVGIINRRRMAPDGQEVVLTHPRHNRIIMRLSEVSDWKTDLPAETLAAERIGRWHPVVATLRKDGRLDSISRDLRSKASRLLHAVAREAEARGYRVRAPERNRHGYIEDRTRLTGDLIIVMPEIECSVKIVQPTDRIPHTPTADELERQRKYNNWPPPQYDYVPANRLNMTMTPAAGTRRKSPGRKQSHSSLSSASLMCLSPSSAGPWFMQRRLKRPGLPRSRNESGKNRRMNLHGRLMSKLHWVRRCLRTWRHGQLLQSSSNTSARWPSRSSA